MAELDRPEERVSKHDAVETLEWLESIESVLQISGPERMARLLEVLQIYAGSQGVSVPHQRTTPYCNSIPTHLEPDYPGDLKIEQRIRAMIRWNAMAMVVRANREEDGIGGHIATYASAATLYEVGFHHFFHAPSDTHAGDLVYYQGHASPGIYARAFLEGRLSDQHLGNFRRELGSTTGLTSYPHPWLMPEFWQFPTVSMGLGPIMAIYQARFIKYLNARGLHKDKETIRSKVWAFLGDGEIDEPESLGALHIAAREKLDNLIFVVNCNLQRLDGPVRGNGKVVQELEGVFRGAGWKVIKVLWGSEWDTLFAKDREGRLTKRLEEIVDGQMQKFSVESGEYIRSELFGVDPELLALVEDMSDEQLKNLRRGGHDPIKVYAAYKEAVENSDGPVVILAQTVKGYGMGEAGEGKNITHQQKNLNRDETEFFRNRFSLPLSEKQVEGLEFCRFDDTSPESVYLKKQRDALGGPIPVRPKRAVTKTAPDANHFAEFDEGSSGREVSTTMAFVRLLSNLLKDKSVGRHLVPIVPDEARTFGMESLFRQIGIYSPVGQLYEPVDRVNLMYYRESSDGQILEEGITEAGSMASFIAAGSAYSTFDIPTIPFYIYYSMFGFQRIGDLAWAAADMRCRGFMLGGTAGRTTLSGEGLQHQDGHSHLLAYPIPNLYAYDPAFAYEVAVLVRHGMERMLVKDEQVVYYLTLGNDNYEHPAMPSHLDRQDLERGILAGLYPFAHYRPPSKRKAAAHLLGSGAIMNEVIAAAKLLRDHFKIATDVWSVTSYQQLHRDALDCERFNRLNPESTPRQSVLEQAFEESSGPIIAASDYVKTLPESISSWLPQPLTTLGTDGFGRSDGRTALRRFFEVDANHIAYSTLEALYQDGKVTKTKLLEARQALDIDAHATNPAYC